MNEEPSDISKIIFSFIWSFKKGDNILYNFSILDEVYSARQKSIRKHLYAKPIILIIAAIVECVLEDFTQRIQQHSDEKIPILSNKVIEDFKYIDRGSYLEVKELKKFNHFIDHAKKHKIFGVLPETYNAMDLVRKLRNRLHIQNSEGDTLDRNESMIFTELNLRNSQDLLKLVLMKMTQTYPRPGAMKVDFGKVKFPWSS